MDNLVRIDQFEDITAKYLNRYCDTTKTRYTQPILNFFNVKHTYQIKINDIKNTTLIQAQTYISKLLAQRDKSKSGSGIKATRSALSSFFKWTIGTYDLGISNVWNHPTIEDMIKLNLPKTDVLPKGKILSEEEIKNIIDNITNLRDRAMLRLMFNTGARRGEVEKIKFSDFYQFEDKWFLDVDGKGRKERAVFVSDKLISELKEYGGKIFTLGLDPYPVFDITGKTVNEIVKKYCGKDITAHKVRHNAATHMVMKNAKNVQLQDQFGWSSIATADKYIHFVERFTNSAGMLVDF